MDIEKTMRFILDTQARLEASVAEHDERLSRLEDSVTRLEASVETVTGLVGRLAQAEISLVEKMDRLAESHADLANSQTHTDQRLDALIDIVDRLFPRNEPPRQ